MEEGGGRGAPPPASARGAPSQWGMAGQWRTHRLQREVDAAADSDAIPVGAKQAPLNH